MTPCVKDRRMPLDILRLNDEVSIYLHFLFLTTTTAIPIPAISNNITQSAIGATSPRKKANYMRYLVPQTIYFIALYFPYYPNHIPHTFHSTPLLLPL